MNFQPYKWVIPAFVFFACNHSSSNSTTDFLAADIDSTASPASDFFSYANGGWIKRNPIPETESSWGLGNLVQEEIYDRLKKINADAVDEKAPEGSTTRSEEH